MKVSKAIEIDYGHTLPDHFSFCNQIHGHRAKIIATVEGELQESGSSNGMVYDFKILKELLMEKIHNVLDHGFAVWKNDTREVVNGVSTLEFIQTRNNKVLVMDTPPTAEALAKWSFNEISNSLPKEIKLTKLLWYETPNSYAEIKAD